MNSTLWADCTDSRLPSAEAGVVLHVRFHSIACTQRGHLLEYFRKQTSLIARRHSQRRDGMVPTFGVFYLQRRTPKAGVASVWPFLVRLLFVSRFMLKQLRTSVIHRPD
jgi:hypothetical protein